MNELTESADKPAPSHTPPTPAQEDRSTTNERADEAIAEPLEPRRLAPADTEDTMPEPTPQSPPAPADVPLPLPAPPTPEPDDPVQRDAHKQARRSFKEMVSRFSPMSPPPFGRATTDTTHKDSRHDPSADTTDNQPHHI